MKYFSAILFCLTLCAANLAAFGQTTQFTYQGSLKNSGVAANGNFDFEFALYSAGGTQLGPTVALNNVPVANGIFAVTLDFGNQFPGASRLLEIRVRPTGSGTAFTILTPRQVVSTSPYSMRSSISTIADNALLLGGLPAASFIQNTTTQQSSTNFNIGGTGNASVFNATTQFNIGGSRVFTISGVENTFAGINAGLSNTASVGNSFFGNSAGQNNSTGGQNSFFGARAGQLSNGTGNSFFGYSAGLVNTLGSDNSFFGAGAGDANTTANSNSFFGRVAGGNNTSGSENSFFGTRAGQSNVGASFNSFFGYEAGKASFTNSINNSFFGHQAGLLTGNGSNNSFFGSSSGAGNTDGTDNSFFGVSSGRANNDGNRNSFYGRLSGRFNTFGSDNTFVGYNSGDSNTIGNNNTLVGSETDVVGPNSISFGTAIGAGATVATSNTVVLGRTSDQVLVKGIFKATQLQFGSSFTVNYESLSLPGNNAACWGTDEIYGNYFGKCVSSIRFKTNVNDFKDGLELINRLRPVTFDWKSNGSTTIGLIAEEVNEVEPLLAVKDKDNVVESVRFEGVTVVLVNAVKQQQKQIEDQQKQIEEQRELLERQRLALEALRKLVCAQNTSIEVCRPLN
ncbi:MAG: tail fiber domain-containing protein [Acidobacteria bacterium]|nr:tail fiber domain-containing protein [Acidobacteriota bacterium]